jgi:hypothetical protein
LTGGRTGPYSDDVRVTAVKRFRAWLLLATFAASLASSSLTFDHLGIIDAACGDVGLSTGADGARLANPDGGAEHCPVCHYLRAVSGASASAPVRLSVQQGLALEFISASHRLVTVDPVTQPSRGPPAPTPTIYI